MMTPQLFINYKMKSVAHLPWRMMTYKALNTFIDDLFAFVIKMPTLYRLGCFRDGKDNYATKHVQIITFFGTFIKVRNPEVLFCNSVKSPQTLSSLSFFLVCPRFLRAARLSRACALFSLNLWLTDASSIRTPLSDSPQSSMIILARPRIGQGGGGGGTWMTT